MTAQPIKPIETHYNGYRFRSRLEARWAVFLDSLNITWRYENEGYNLGQIGYYLPDFDVIAKDKSRWCIEVKPNKDIPEDELIKMRVFDNAPPENIYGLIYAIGVPEASDEGEWREYKTTGDLSIVTNAELVAMMLSIGDRASIVKAVKSARSARFEHGETP